MSFLRDFVDEGPVGKRRLPQLSKADMVGTKYDDEDDELEKVEKEEAELAKKHRGVVAVLEI